MKKEKPFKPLSDYIHDEQTELFKQYGAFFAFSDKQFDERAEPGVDYVSVGAGLLCPQDVVKELLAKLDDLIRTAIEKHKKDFSKERIIRYELANHEYAITGSIEETQCALDGYGFTADEILKVASSVDWDEYLA